MVEEWVENLAALIPYYDRQGGNATLVYRSGAISSKTGEQSNGTCAGWRVIFASILMRSVKLSASASGSITGSPCR